MSKVYPADTECIVEPMTLPQAAEECQPGVTPFVAPTVGQEAAARNPAISAKVIEDAKAAARKAGFEEGLVQGRKEGQAAAAQEHGAQLMSLRSSFEELVGYRATIREEVEREVVDLAFAVAKRVLRREATLDRAAVAGIVRSCLDERSAAEVSKILVHPDDLDQVRLCVGDGVTIEASTEVGRGGALLETARGRLDARIDSQIDELKTGLADG